jgi:hypothetical protein
MYLSEWSFGKRERKEEKLMSDHKIDIVWNASTFPSKDKDALKRAILGGMAMQGFIVSKVYDTPGGGGFQVQVKG